jgi:predicted RNA-binding Zn-ribbon protein involved in translation (DUF1610 family)
VTPRREEAETPPICITCGYNLTSLTSERCPECGWQINWTLARSDEESRRPGTYAHRARGWRIIDQTVLTVLMMLFAPWRFAQVLRSDESVLPAMAVALLSYVATFANLETFAILRRPSGPSGYDAVLFGAAILAVILTQSVTFASLTRPVAFPKPRWPQRLRLWMLASLYSTCFVAAWRFTPPPIADFMEPNFYVPWMLHGARWVVGPPELGTSIIFYWWWLILTCVLLIRNRPRWLALVCIPLVYLFALVGRLAYQATGSLVDLVGS